MSSHQKSWEFWNDEWWWREDGGSQWVRWSELIDEAGGWTSGGTWWGEDGGSERGRSSQETNKSYGWTGGAPGSAGVSGRAGILEPGQVDGAQSSWRTSSLGGDESAGAGAGPPGVSTGGPDDAMNEIEDLRTFQVWAEFVGKVREAIRGAPRHALAQHITTSKQPQRIDGVSVSLSSCGADEVHQRDGMHECHIALKNLLEVGDGLALNYVSVGHKKFKEAQRAAFVEILSYILFRGPRYLRNHASQWDAFGFEVVLGEAESAVGFQGLRSRLGPRPRGQWSPLAAPFPPEEGQATRTSTRGSSSTGYQPPAAGENPADRDNEILQALSAVPRRRANRAELPPTVWPVLERLLPAGGLLPFLRRFPDQFVVTSERPLVWQRL